MNRANEPGWLVCSHASTLAGGEPVVAQNGVAGRDRKENLRQVIVGPMSLSTQFLFSSDSARSTISFVSLRSELFHQ
jgi:hypothetical protein